MPPLPARVLAFAALLAALAPLPARAQTFTRVNDPANPIATDTGAVGFSGASWIDIDGNGWDDLFLSNAGYYLNFGGGVFTKHNFAGNAFALGNSWADFDNDGDPDVMLAGTAITVGNLNLHGSRLFRNDGGGTFTLVTTAPFADSLGNAGWTAAWGDYDADGWADLVIAAPLGFTGFTPNRLFHNNRDGTLSYDLSTDVTTGLAPYTIPTWADFDLDGDLDLSIGAGPANGTRALDYFYRNTRIEGGDPKLLKRITTGLPATQTRDGQIINWPDYDNDGDRDCYITNYNNSSNHFYRNDGGTYVRLTLATTGTIATEVGWNLSSTWEDFDNDGDLDCFVVRTSGFACRYYRNDGTGKFTSLSLDSLTSFPASTAAAADYDQDGDLDLYVSSPGVSKALYRNDTAPGNHWFALRLVGVNSNRSAIGAKVRVRATIGGVEVTQFREVSSQDVFNGQSSAVRHFGLGDAAAVAWMSVEWPSGLVETFTNLPRDTTLTLVEGEGFPTPTLASLIGWKLTPLGLALEWYGDELVPGGAIVHRRAIPDAEWIALGVASSETPHRVTYVDATAKPGTWGYRLGDASGWLTEETIVEVPAAALSLRARSAPGGRLRLEFVLPAAGAVRAQVYDARGRRVGGRDLGALPAGSHALDLDGAPLVPGIYWVRLAQGGATATSKAVIAGR